MEKKLEQEPLIYPESSHNVKSSSKNIYIILLITLFFVVVLGSAVLLLLNNNIQKSLLVVDEIRNTPQLSRQNELDALYASEAIPHLPSSVGSDLYNYGLSNITETADGIEGTLVFSGVPVDSNLTTQIYTLDLSSSEQKTPLLLPSYVFSAFPEFLDKNKPSDFFLSTVDYRKSSLGIDPDGERIQKYDLETGNLETFESMTGLYEQNMEWSPVANLLAYSRLAVPFNGYTDLVSITNWEVVISDPELDKVVKVIDSAFQPKWSPDGTKLIVLKSDGLYVFDLVSGTETIIVNAKEGRFLTTSMVDVSPNGQYLAWTIARAGVIVMNEIVSWAPFTIKEQGRIHVNNTEYYWPQFSPDSSYYVVQAIDSAKEGETVRNNPRFEIRATLGRSVLRTFSVQQFDFNGFFTDTWIANLPVTNASESSL